MAPEQKTWQSMQAAKLLLSQPESLAGLSLSYTEYPSFRNILKHARLKGKDSICEGLAVRQVTGLPAPPSAVIPDGTVDGRSTFRRQDNLAYGRIASDYQVFVRLNGKVHARKQAGDSSKSGAGRRYRLRRSGRGRRFGNLTGHPLGRAQIAGNHRLP